MTTINDLIEKIKANTATSSAERDAILEAFDAAIDRFTKDMADVREAIKGCMTDAIAATNDLIGESNCSICTIDKDDFIGKTV